MLGGKRKGCLREKDGHARLGNGKGLAEGKRKKEEDYVMEVE